MTRKQLSGQTKRKTRNVTRYQVLQCNSIDESVRKLRRIYTRKTAQRAMRLLRRFGLEAWISPLSVTETR